LERRSLPRLPNRELVLRRVGGQRGEGSDGVDDEALVPPLAAGTAWTSTWQLKNFGFHSTRNSTFIGTNAKAQLG
jgi:hypothetical protein